jgi:hypothetical protein
MAAIVVFIFSVWAWAAATDVSGVWTGQITGPSGDKHDITFNLKADAGKLTGSITGGPPDGAEQAIVNGKIEGKDVSFDVNTNAPDGSAIKLNYAGTVADNQIKGVTGTPMGSLPFTVTKKK